MIPISDFSETDKEKRALVSNTAQHKNHSHLSLATQHPIFTENNLIRAGKSCIKNKLGWRGTVPYHAATYWNRRFSKPPQNETTLVPVTFASSIKINPVAAVRSVLKVILPNKIAIEVEDDFSPTALTKLLATLERR